MRGSCLLPPLSCSTSAAVPGAYAFRLAETGYRVHLIDAAPLHVQQARLQAADTVGRTPESISLGDARRLEFPDAGADAALLMGPLYHLTERSDRILALREAHRCLRQGGIVCAVGISRFAAALDGMARGFLWDSEFAEIVAQDLTDGQHRNPADHPHYFTTAFFHRPDELRAETAEAGFYVEHVLAIEGPAWACTDLASSWRDDARRKTLLDVIRRLEEEPALIGASAHIMVIGRKQ